MAVNHEAMMLLTVDARRKYFRDAYTIELGRLHAAGKCAWPAERLPEMVERVVYGVLARRVPSGPAFDATMKFFGLKTQKALFAFLGVAA